MIETKLNRCVNVSHIADPLTQNKAGFVQHGQEDAVHDKARRIVCMHHFLAQGLSIAFHRCDRFVRSRKTPDEFDEAHDRHRIEEMHARKRSEEHTSELQSLMRISYAV